MVKQHGLDEPAPGRPGPSKMFRVDSLGDAAAQSQSLDLYLFIADDLSPFFTLGFDIGRKLLRSGAYRACATGIKLPEQIRVLQLS